MTMVETSNQVTVSNLNAGANVEQVKEFFGFLDPSASQCGVDLRIDGDNCFAVLHVDAANTERVLCLNGAEFMGKKLRVEAAIMEVTPSITPTSEQPQTTTQSPDVYTVELDFSHAKDVYEYQNLTRVEVVMAVRQTFGDDDSRRLMPPGRKNETIWAIETDNIDL